MCEELSSQRAYCAIKNLAYNIPSSSLERELAEKRKKTLSAGTERLLKLKLEKLNMTHLLTWTRADSGAGEGGGGGRGSTASFESKK